MWNLADKQVRSRLLLGTALYPSPEVMCEAIRASQCDVVTVSLRRQAPGSKGGSDFWRLIKELKRHILPNTAGCQTVRDAVNTARMSRELFDTDWIKLEVIADDFTLAPNPTYLLEAATELVKEGFTVFPYTTSDVKVAHQLADAGCSIVMPWAAPIGTGQGPTNLAELRQMRQELPDTTLIVDAGIGLPSHAAQVMELGFDGVLLNSAVALALDPRLMASAFADAVRAGRDAFLAGPMPRRESAQASTPTVGTPFWHQVGSV